MTAELFATPATPLQIAQWTPQLVLLWDLRAVLEPGFAIELGRLHEVVIDAGHELGVSYDATAGIARITLAGEREQRLARLVKAGIGWELEAIAASADAPVTADGQQVTGRRPLVDGTRIEVGPGCFVYRIGQLIKGGVAHEHELYPPQPTMATFSGSLASKHKELARVALNDVPVLVLGETGTGKERVARAIHELAGRTGAFVAVNCGAVPAGMVEASLFGHRKGAFSGALEDRPGLIRSAERGTLFLDEVGELPLPAQAALLRVLQEREVTPVGETRPVKVNVRLVAATNQDLAARVARGEFRQDLLARLSGYEFKLPALAARMEDIGLIVRAVVRGKEPRRRDLAFTHNVARALLRYEWPSNIRELEHALTSALSLAPSGAIQSPHLPDRLRSAPRAPTSPIDTPPGPVRAVRPAPADVEALLVEHHGNVARAAAAAGMHETAFRRLLARYGIDLARFRS